MLDQKSIDQLTQAVNTPWPQEAGAVYQYCKNIMGVFFNWIPQNTNDDRVDNMLQQLSDVVWWHVWATGQDMDSWVGDHTCLVREKIRRTNDLINDPDRASEVLAGTVQSGRLRDSVWCALVNALVDDESWPINTPESLVPLTTHLAHNASTLNLVPQTTSWGLERMWDRLCAHRAQRNSAELTHATEHLWGLLPSNLHKDCWSSFVVAMGHNPGVFVGALAPEARTPDECTHALTKMANTTVFQKPVDVPLVERIARPVPASDLAMVMQDITATTHTEDWMSDVLTALCRLEPCTTTEADHTNTRRIISMIGNCARLGLTRPMLDMTAAAGALTLKEARTVVSDLLGPPLAAWPTAFVAFMDTLPPPVQAHVLGVVCAKVEANAPLAQAMQEGLAQSWSALDPVYATELLNTYPLLVDIPSVQTLHEARSIYAHVDEPASPRRPSKM